MASPRPDEAALGAPGSIRLGRRIYRDENDDVVIQRLDERRYAVAVDGIVRYVGSQEECQRRAEILSPRTIAMCRMRVWRVPVTVPRQQIEKEPRRCQRGSE
jgi:hypothetical protein